MKSRHLDIALRIAPECVCACDAVYHPNMFTIYTLPYIIFGNHTVKSSKQHTQPLNCLHEMRDAKERRVRVGDSIPTDNECN